MIGAGHGHFGARTPRANQELALPGTRIRPDLTTLSFSFTSHLSGTLTEIAFHRGDVVLW